MLNNARQNTVKVPGFTHETLPVADRIAEATIFLMVCAAPWMFGSVEAWAELLLTLGTVLVVVLTTWSGRVSLGSRFRVGRPGLALLGLALLGLVQTIPMGERGLATVDPVAGGWRRDSDFDQRRARARRPRASRFLAIDLSQ